MRLRQLTILIFAFVVLTFTKAQDVALELAGPVAQDVTYCCGNHKPSHCGRANELSEFERKYGCKNWKVERRDNYDDATTASESSRFEQAEVRGLESIPMPTMGR